MKLEEITEDGSAYSMAVQTISKKKFDSHFDKNKQKATIWLNNYSLQLRAERLPYAPYVNTIVQRGIDMGAEGLIIKKGK